MLIGSHAAEETTTSTSDSRKAKGSTATAAEPIKVDPAANILANPELAQMGRPLKSNRPLDLTEAELEYTVTCIKHMYANAVVLEFKIINTLEDKLLEDCFVRVDTSDMEGISDVKLIPVPRLAYGTPGTAFTVLEVREGEFPLGTMSCTMRFTDHDVDPATGEVDEGGYPDEYQLDYELTIGLSDLMAPPAELPSSFKAAWETLDGEHEIVETYTLRNQSWDSVAAAVKDVIKFLGMAACEGTERVSDRATGHVLLSAGVFVPNIDVLSRSQITLKDGTVELNFIARSQDGAVLELVAGSIG